MLSVERCRNKNKNLTEVVEFKPVDLDAHFKGIEQRKLARSQALENRKLKPQTRPVPIMQTVPQTTEKGKNEKLDNSSRGATKYASNEIDISSRHALREADVSRQSSPGSRQKSPFKQRDQYSRQRNNQSHHATGVEMSEQST